MKYKISKLEIKNYKCLPYFLFNFNENNLIVFDGPNGYGKTTCFEALEILFTKKPRKIHNVNLDKRYTYQNSPIHYNGNANIEITAQIISDGKIFDIKRVISPADQKKSKKNNISIIFDESKLYINEKEVTETDLERLLNYDNLQRLFNVLNYVEQDENTFFLKEDPKNRYRALISLFGGNEERNLLDKVNSFLECIKSRIAFYENSIEEIKKTNKDLMEDKLVHLNYNRLIEEEQFAWDNEVIYNTDIGIHNSYLNEINKVEVLVINKNVINDLFRLKRINTFRNSDHFLMSFTNYYWHINNFDLLKEEDTKRNRYVSIININDTIIKQIDSANYNYLASDEVIKILSGKTEIPFELEAYKIALTTLIASHENLSLQNRILSELKVKRENFIEFNKQHTSIINLKESECPTCGYDWQNFQFLTDQIKETEGKIFSQYKKDNISFEQYKLKLCTYFLNPLKELLIEEKNRLNDIIRNLISAEEFLTVKEKYEGLKRNIDLFLSLFDEKIQKEMLSYVNFRFIENKESINEKILSIIDEVKPNIQIDVDTEIVLTDFERYFNSDMSKLDKLNIELIVNKKQYIKWQYYNSINNKVIEYSKQLEKINNFKEQVDNIKNVLNEEIKNYTKSIIDNISIPFYIFTGKILQNHSLGSGLIIDFEINRQDSQIYIRPVGKDQEVTYALSSGQLSATVISLMLVLNKVFNHSKFGALFIDDPLQTLDEINLHSLVELLKYNFSDQQLFMSTHEDRYSRFIRYKYDKFRLRSKNINMKENISYSS